MRSSTTTWTGLGGLLGVLTAFAYLHFEAPALTSKHLSFNRSPASEKTPGLLTRVRELNQIGNQVSLSAQNCVSRLDQLTKEVLRSDITRYPLRSVEAHAEEAIRELFALRMSLMEQARPVLLKGASSEACALQLRRALRHLRGAEDYIGALGYQAKKREFRGEHALRPHSPVVAVQDKTRVAPQPRPIAVHFPSPGNLPPPSYVPTSTLLNPSLTVAPGVRSGDVLLSRGNAATSALIARMANEDTQFSHMALVYIDPETRKSWTIEAHIEYGSIVTPLHEWLSDGKARTMIFRHSDADLAHRAAQWMFKRVEPRYRADQAIEYDFPFDMNDHSKLFCSEVVREGFKHASEGRIQVPLFPSRIAMRNRDLMNRLGISVTSSFIPGDIELDPRFTVIGEWRNFEKLPDVWQKDAVLTSVYDWLERDGYRFDPTIWLEAKGRIARTIRKAGMIKNRMPTYMPEEAVVLSFMIGSITEELQLRLSLRDAEKKARTGFPMTYYELLTELRQIKGREGHLAKGPFQYLHP